MTRDDVEDLFEAVTGHNIAHGAKSEGRSMYLSSDEVVEFARKIAAHETEACAELCHKYAQTAFNNSSQNAAVELRDAIWARRQE